MGGGKGIVVGGGLGGSGSGDNGDGNGGDNKGDGRCGGCEVQHGGSA